MAYQAFRQNGFPTYYAENKTAWQADILEAGLIFAFCIVAVSFFVILPGIRGKEKLFTFIRVTLSLYIGGVLILTNWTYSWETSEIHTRTKYKAGTGAEISADIGVHIGLRGINITLKGNPDVHQLNETINYNEHFSWEWEQGRLGFGPFAGPFNQQYRAAQFRGLPLPILWIAEYFTFDGEGIRWGRHYRQAGWYTHIMLWLSFPLWILTNILFLVVLRYGAIFLIMTGSSMLIGNIIWATLRNVNELMIPWEEGIMEFSFGGSFYICLLTAILCIILGITVLIMDLRFPTQLDTFFGVDPSLDSEENQQDDDDDVNDAEPKTRLNDDMEMSNMDDSNGALNRQRSEPLLPPKPQRVPKPRIELPDQDEEDELYMAPVAPPTPHKYEKRRRSIGKYLQKSRRCRPPPPPPIHEGSQEMYVNEPKSAGREKIDPGQSSHSVESGQVDAFRTPKAVPFCLMSQEFK